MIIIIHPSPPNHSHNEHWININPKTPHPQKTTPTPFRSFPPTHPKIPLFTPPPLSLRGQTTHSVNICRHTDDPLSPQPVVVSPTPQGMTLQKRMVSKLSLNFSTNSRTCFNKNLFLKYPPPTKIHPLHPLNLSPPPTSPPLFL